MNQSIDAIPVRVPPLSGESLDSWLEFYAYRLQSSVTDLLGLAQVRTSRWRNAFGASPWTPALYPSDFEALSLTTGVSQAQLGMMTLDQYDGTLLTLDHTNKSWVLKASWQPMRSSRYCPQCLAESGGRWMLKWRLPWYFACLRHDCLLLDRCPACRQRARGNWGGREGQLFPGACRAPESHDPGTTRAGRCLQILAEAPTLALATDARALASQRNIKRRLEGIALAARTDPGEHREAALALEDLHASARAVFSTPSHCLDRPTVVEEIAEELQALPHEIIGTGDSARAVLQTDSKAAAFALTIAESMLRDGPSAPQQEISQWLLSAASPKGSTAVQPGAVVNRWKESSAVLQGALLKQIGPRLGPSDQLRYGTWGASPAKPAPALGAARARWVPSLFWRGLALRLTPPEAFGPSPLYYRAALSSMTLLVGSSDLTQRQAKRLLFSYDIDGLPARLGHTLRRLRELGYLDSVMAAITDVAQVIDNHGSPIDHARRRALFSEADLDLNFCYRFCDQTGRTRPTENKQRHLRLRMIELLTGTHPRYMRPPLRLDVSLQGVYGRLVLQLPEPYAVHLQEQAQRHLDAAGIHEPLQWEPPASWTTGNGLPGPELSSLPRELLWERIRNGSSARTLAREYGTSIEHVRVFADLNPVPDTSSRPHRSKFPLSELPSADQIKRSYANGARLQEISETFGYSRGVIRRLCRIEGVPVNHPGRQYSCEIDPSWFRQEYLVKQRSISDIADEMKVSRNTIQRQAVAFGVCLRSRSEPKHLLAAYGNPDDYSSGVWQAFTGRYGRQRVERFVALASYGSLTEAARELRTTHALLGVIIGHLEKATEVQLVDRDGQGRRMTALTMAGENLRRSAVKVLQQLEETESDGPPSSGSVGSW